MEGFSRFRTKPNLAVDAGVAPGAAQGFGAGVVVSVDGVGATGAAWPLKSWVASLTHWPVAAGSTWKGFGPPMALRTGSWTSLYILWRMAWPPGIDSRFWRGGLGEARYGDICLSMQGCH